MKDPAALGIYLRRNVYWLGQQRNHKRVLMSLETKDYEEAIRRAREIRERPELNQGGLLAAEIERYVAHKLATGIFSRATAANAANFLAHLPRLLGDVAPFQVSAGDAKSFYETLRKRMTESSAQTYVAHARSFFEWCVKSGRLCDTNPFGKLELPELISVARKEFCRPLLRDKLLNECQRDDLRFVLFCGFHAGLRRNEIAEARPGWFDLDQRLLSIKKISEGEAERTGLDPFDLKDREERSIPLSAAFTKFLLAWPLTACGPNSDYCLGVGVRRGRSRYRFDMRRPFEDYMKAWGCPWVTFHTMRRTFASLQASKSTSIYLIATWLGDDIETTRRHYAHLIPAHDKLEAGL